MPWLPRKRSSMLRQRTRRSTCWQPPSSLRSTSFSAPGWSGCARRSRSPVPTGDDAPALLLDAARRLEPLDAAMARETHLEAIAAAMFAGRLGDYPGVRDAAEAAQAAPAAPQPPRAIDLLLDALVTRFTDGYEASVAPLSEALRRFPTNPHPAGGRGPRAGCGWHVASRKISGTTSSGTRSRPVACASPATPARSTCSRTRLNYLAALNVHSGDFATAAVLIEEVDAITQATRPRAAQVRGVHAGGGARRSRRSCRRSTNPRCGM